MVIYMQFFDNAIIFSKPYDEAYRYEDVLPKNATSFTIGGLEKNTDYVFSVMSINKMGQSKYRPDDTKATTLSKYYHLTIKLVLD